MVHAVDDASLPLAILNEHFDHLTDSVVEFKALTGFHVNTEGCKESNCKADSLAVEIPMEDLSPLSEAEQQRQVMAFLNNEWREPFDLAHGPLLRVKLLKLAEEDHVLLRTFHHIVSDKWS